MPRFNPRTGNGELYYEYEQMPRSNPGTENGEL